MPIVEIDVTEKLSSAAENGAPITSFLDRTSVHEEIHGVASEVNGAIGRKRLRVAEEDDFPY
ncbi:hypothetical protein [Streptomyces sp. NPDC051572]|uniref:hypothetical protein n=1 Tax=Streptomyces sp. NPDC051572 TaxID=3155802 RepID=UPI003450FAFB